MKERSILRSSPRNLPDALSGSPVAFIDDREIYTRVTSNHPSRGGRTGRPRSSGQPTMIGERFGSREESLPWLANHGDWKLRTPKTWLGERNDGIGWRQLNSQPSKRELLQLAISENDPENHRRQWRLHHCMDDPDCPCHELLDEHGMPQA
jgi:hypothetical protein